MENNRIGCDHPIFDREQSSKVLKEALLAGNHSETNKKCSQWKKNNFLGHDYGIELPCVALYGFYGFYGRVWPYMVVYGRVWPCMAVYGPIWPYVAV